MVSDALETSCRLSLPSRHFHTKSGFLVNNWSLKLATNLLICITRISGATNQGLNSYSLQLADFGQLANHRSINCLQSGIEVAFSTIITKYVIL